MNSIRDLNKLALMHYDWVERMNWHNKTTLESLALIGSEIGEVAEECLSGQLTNHFGEELADIFLRVGDLALTEKVDLEALMKNTEITWRTNSYSGYINELMIEWANWVNTARKKELGEDFVIFLGKVLKRVFSLAEMTQINIFEEIIKKIAINEKRGTRGRII